MRDKVEKRTKKVGGTRKRRRETMQRFLFQAGGKVLEICSSHLKAIKKIMVT